MRQPNYYLHIEYDDPRWETLTVELFGETPKEGDIINLPLPPVKSVCPPCMYKVTRTQRTFTRGKDQFSGKTLDHFVAMPVQVWAVPCSEGEKSLPKPRPNLTVVQMDSYYGAFVDGKKVAEWDDYRTVINQALNKMAEDGLLEFDQESRDDFAGLPENDEVFPDSLEEWEKAAMNYDEEKDV